MELRLPTKKIKTKQEQTEYNEIDDSERISLAHKKLSDIDTELGSTETNVFEKMGDEADEIKEMANEKNIDLIIIGTHGRSGIKLLLGSTANSVLHGVQHDVLAVRVYG